MSEGLPTIEDMYECSTVATDDAPPDEPETVSEFDLWDHELDGPPPAEPLRGKGVHDVAADELEAMARQRRLATAEEYRLIAQILRAAELDPDFWTGPDPTLDPSWVDPRTRSVAAIRRERREFAVRAAVADVAVRLRMSETTVRTRGAHAETLRRRMPRLWALFLAGAVSEQNASTAAALAASLPDESPDSWAELDERVAAVADVLTPAKFRVTARAARERVHPEDLDQRHRRAAEDRDVWCTPELDGMATLSAFMPAVQARAVVSRVDAHARHLAAQPGEERTLAQLRADVFADLLTMGPTDASAPPIRPTVAVTIRR